MMIIVITVGLSVVVLITDICYHRLFEIRLLPGGCRTLAVGEGDFAFSEARDVLRS